MRLGLKHAEPEATVWKNILVSRRMILQTEGMVCINAQSQEKFCPVRNLMTNAVYAVINTSYFFFISDGYYRNRISQISVFLDTNL